MSKLIRMDHTGHSTLAEWTPGDPAQIVEAEGLAAMTGGADALDPIVEAALAANADAAEKIKAGNMKAIGAIIGHVMRETKGRADGAEVTRIVREKLGL